MIRVLSVDDHALLREGIAALVGNQADMELVAEACDGREAVELFRKHRPDVTLMDLQMPEMGGIDALSAIRGEFRKPALSSSPHIPGISMVSISSLRSRPFSR